MPRKANVESEETLKVEEEQKEAPETMVEESATIPEAENVSEKEKDDFPLGTADDPDTDAEEDAADIDEGYDVEIVTDESSSRQQEQAQNSIAERVRRIRQSNFARTEERERQQVQSQAQIANESALISAIHTQRIFTDKVAAVEEIRLGDHTDVAAIVILGKSFKVIIPYNELFKESPVRPEEFNNLEHSIDRFNFMRQKRRYIQRMIGGQIPFCLTAYE